MYRYAKIGEVHDRVSPHDLEIIAEDGTEIKFVIEANAEEGWLIRYKTDNGQIIERNGTCLTEKLEAKFFIRRHGDNSRL